MSLNEMNVYFERDGRSNCLQMTYKLFLVSFSGTAALDTQALL